MTTPSSVLSKTLGGSTHSGSSLCSEYAPLGAVSMGCHCGCASSHTLSVYSSISSTLYAASRYSLLWSSHFLNSVIFHLLYTAHNRTKIHPHRAQRSTLLGSSLLFHHVAYDIHS